MAITSGVRHFVMAITSAEAMARHTAFGDGHHIGPDGHYTGLSWAQLLCFFSAMRAKSLGRPSFGGTAKPARLR
jgi:hypothetical protein